MSSFNICLRWYHQGRGGAITNEDHNLCCQQGIDHCSITTGTEDISRWNCDLDELNLGAEKRLIITIVSNVRANLSTHPRWNFSNEEIEFSWSRLASFGIGQKRHLQLQTMKSLCQEMKKKTYGVSQHYKQHALLTLPTLYTLLSLLNKSTTFL